MLVSWRITNRFGQYSVSGFNDENKLVEIPVNSPQRVLEIADIDELFFGVWLDDCIVRPFLMKVFREAKII